MRPITPTEAIENAMWDGDLDRLNELAGCVCCCYEHTFANCPARVWDGCRGSGSEDPVGDAEAWRAFYGMTPEEFYGS